MAVRARILVLPSNAVAQVASPVNDVMSSPSSAHVRMAQRVWKVKDHTTAFAKVVIPEGTAKEMSTTANLILVKTVSRLDVLDHFR